MIVAPPNARRTRRGYSLIEMLAVMTVISILMGAGSIALIKINRYARNAAARAATATTLTHVGREFRLDAHAATSVTVDGDNTLRFAADDSMITYAAADNGLTRSINGRVASTLFDGYRVTFVASDRDEPRVVRLFATPNRPGWPAYEYAAAVGLKRVDTNSEPADAATTNTGDSL